MTRRRRLPAFALRAAFALSALATFALIALAFTAPTLRAGSRYLIGVAIAAAAGSTSSIAINYRRVHDTDHENRSDR